MLILQVLPQLASLDEVTYAACTTIKDPKKTTLALQMGLAKINGDIPIETLKEILEEQKGKLANEEEKLEKSPVGDKENLLMIESNEQNSQTDSEGEQENRTERLECETEDAVVRSTVEERTEDNAHDDETPMPSVDYKNDESDQVKSENLMQNLEIEDNEVKEEGEALKECSQ